MPYLPDGILRTQAETQALEGWSDLFYALY
jgi:hypothetical protein